jgi:hypothetical protein
MSNWMEQSNELKESLQLRTEPIAYRRLEKAGDLDNIEDVTRIKFPVPLKTVLPNPWPATQKNA